MSELSERVLVLDSVAGESANIAGWLASRGLKVDVAERLQGPELARYGLVVLDMDLLQSDWSRQLSGLRHSAPETEVILTTQAGEGSVEAAV